MTGLRRASMLLSVAWVFACATTTAPADGSSKPSRRGKDSATTASPIPTTKAAPAAIEALSMRSQALTAPVAVVSLAARDASPCEQMCGRVGDCLDDREPLEASHLELGCLDLCVNVREETDEARLFRGCQQRNACGELIDCVGNNWSAAAAARVEYDTLVDAAAIDTCELYCRGIYGCMYYNKTVSQGIDFPPDTEREIESCVQVCDPADPTAIDLAGCASEPTCDDYWQCYEAAQTSRYP